MLRGVEQEFSIDRQRGSYAQTFARPVVDLIGNGVKLIPTVAREVGPSGQVLTHKSVGVLVGAALPWAVRVTEVHRHLPPLVVRHALAHGPCNAQQLVGEGLHHVDRV